MKTQLLKRFAAAILVMMLSCSILHAQTTSDLDEFVLKQMKDDNIPGMAISVVRDGKIIWANGYGFADIDRNIPFTPNTINAEIASISKTVTAVAVMQLWEDGEFELDDAINDYLPFPVTNPYYPDDDITFRMLLIHTGSLAQDNDGPAWDYELTLFGKPGASESLASFVENLYTPGGTHYRDGLNFSNVAPGSTHAYSNWGYALLGYLVEEISGVPFDAYCNTNIFQPLCMNYTGWYFSDVDTNIVSRPYLFDHNKNKFIDYGLYEYPDYPDGQIKTSAIDLSKFLLMFQNYGELDDIRILDSATIALMRTIAVIDWQGTVSMHAQGFGFEYYKTSDDLLKGISTREWWGHFGGDNGITTAMFDEITDGTGIIIFSNSENNIPWIILDLMEEIAATVFPDDQSALNCAYISFPCENDHVYWRDHSDSWALNSLPMQIGSKFTYHLEQVLDLLNNASTSDASINLARALIAAKLNMAQGSELSPVVLTVDDAMNLLGDRHLPLKVPVSLSSPEGIQMLALEATLTSYNSGTLNTVPCSGNPLRELGAINGAVSKVAISVFPNPFSISTTITFSLAQSESISLKIFDMKGRLVRTLVNDPLAAGLHTLDWDVNDASGSRAPAGIYVLQLEAGSFLQTERLIVTK